MVSFRFHVAGSILEDEDDCMEDIVCDGNSFNERTNRLDKIMGALEELVAEESFQDFQDSFCAKHCLIFEEGEENKVEYMDIYHEWVGTLDTFLERALVAKCPGESMEDVLNLIQEKLTDGGNPMEDGDIFDMVRAAPSSSPRLANRSNRLGRRNHMPHLISLHRTAPSTTTSFFPPSAQLMSLIDFEAFKELMLSYKRGIELEQADIISALPFATSLKTHDEMEDGDVRSDLDGFALCTRPIR